MAPSDIIIAMSKGLIDLAFNKAVFASLYVKLFCLIVPKRKKA